MRLPVDTAVIVPVNFVALTDDTDFKTREDSVTYDQAGLDLVWNFLTRAGVLTQTAVTPTESAGDYDWQNKGNGIYGIEIPASGGGTINNDTEGYGWFTGFATGILPWTGPIIEFGPEPANAGDQMDLVDAPNATAIAAIQSGLATGTAIDAAKTVVDAIKAVTDLLPDAGALTTIDGLLDTLIARLTAARAGYLDNLNVGGNVASSAEVTAIQNNTRVVRVVPTVVERPDAGTKEYRIELLLYDTNGNMEAPDSAPTIALVNQDGDDLSSRLDSATMSLVSTGRYRAIYTASVGDDLEQLVWTFSVTEGGSPRVYGNTTLIVDTTAVDFTAADRTKLDTLHDDRLTADRAGYLDSLNGHTAQTGDSYAIVNSGTFGNSALKTLIDAVSTLLGTPADSDIATDIANVLAAIGGLNDPTAAAIVTAIFANDVESGLSFLKAVRGIASAVGGKSSGSPGSPVFKGMGVNTDRITAETDSDGNRTSVILSLD